MLKYDKEKLKEILMEEHGLREIDAVDTSKSLTNLSSELQEAMDRWMEDRTVIDYPCVEGVTLRDIQDIMGSFINALQFMDGFLEDSEVEKMFKEGGYPFVEGMPHFSGMDE